MCISRERVYVWEEVRGEGVQHEGQAERSGGMGMELSELSEAER